LYFGASISEERTDSVFNAEMTSALKMEAVCFVEVFVVTVQATQFHNPDAAKLPSAFIF
jgi:hypothetical protein